jgi:hypothetical protein
MLLTNRRLSWLGFVVDYEMTACSLDILLKNNIGIINGNQATQPIYKPLKCHDLIGRCYNNATLALHLFTARLISSNLAQADWTDDVWDTKAVSMPAQRMLFVGAVKFAVVAQPIARWQTYI